MRDTGELASRDSAARQFAARAERLSDRYGRSLGPDGAPPLPPPSRRVRADVDRPVPNSANQPHRSHDGYHGSYNDYLWQLALADGEPPQVAIGSEAEPSRTEAPNTDPPAIEPLVIDQPPHSS